MVFLHNSGICAKCNASCAARGDDVPRLSEKKAAPALSGAAGLCASQSDGKVILFCDSAVFAPDFVKADKVCTKPCGGDCIRADSLLFFVKEFEREARGMLKRWTYSELRRPIFGRNRFICFFHPIN